MVPPVANVSLKPLISMSVINSDVSPASVWEFHLSVLALLGTEIR